MYMYDALHNTIKHVEDDDTFDERGVLKFGKSLRVPMQMMDSMQRSIAADSGTVDDDNVKLVSRQELADWDKAQLSAQMERWSSRWRPRAGWRPKPSCCGQKPRERKNPTS